MDPVSLSVAAALLSKARSLLVVTGAGISAESGIPTFRGAGGLWEGHRAQDLATPAAFQANPELVWRWYRWRKQICNDAEPNAGHRAITTLEQRTPGFLLLTQNVDGLHPRAGTQQLVELHGNIDTAHCTFCGHVRPVPDAPVVPECHLCGYLLRPHILWFGETYWPGVLERAQGAAQRADVCLVVGTSAQVWPPISVALAAQASGAHLIDVNPERTRLTEEADLWIQGTAGDVLPALIGGTAG
jgi:NAD-dependent deacetylase